MNEFQEFRANGFTSQTFKGHIGFMCLSTLKMAFVCVPLLHFFLCCFPDLVQIWIEAQNKHNLVLGLLTLLGH